MSIRQNELNCDELMREIAQSTPDRDVHITTTPTKRKVINQGDIYYAYLPEDRGSEEAGYRPVLVVSSSRMNSWCSTVIVVPLTSNMTHRSLVTHVPFQFQFGKSAKQSLALCEHVKEIDKCFLSDNKTGYTNRRTLSTILGIVKEYILREDYA